MAGPVERRQGLEELLARSRELDLPSAEVQLLGSLAGVARRQGDVDGAVEVLRAAAARAESIGFAWSERGIRELLARVLLEEGNVADAREEGRRALELARRTGDRLGSAWSLTFFRPARVADRQARASRRAVGRAEAEAERKPLGIWAEDRAEAEEALPLDDPTSSADASAGAAWPSTRRRTRRVQP